MAVTGVAQTNERVSEFLRNTAYHSPWLERPELVEIKAAAVTTARDQKRLFEFAVRLTLKRPQDKEQAASPLAPGASGVPAAAAPAASGPAS